MPFVKESITSDSKLKDVLTQNPWKQDKDAKRDVKIADTLVQSYTDSISQVVGGGAKIAAIMEQKINAYCRANFFIPIAIESLSTIYFNEFNFFKELGQRVSMVTNDT